MKASDPDLDENGEIKYSLADTHGNTFGINPYTREIVVKRLDERDLNTEVVLKVIAQDKGDFSLNYHLNHLPPSLSFSLCMCGGGWVDGCVCRIFLFVWVWFFKIFLI